MFNNNLQSTNIQRELTNRKILEDLQIKKTLLKQGVVSSLQSSVSITNDAATTSAANNIASQQRLALENVQSQSFGFFVSQNSLFGNMILPVLPRFDTAK